MVRRTYEILHENTHDYANTHRSDYLESRPLRRVRVGFEQGEQAAADHAQCPAYVVQRAVLVGHFDEYTTDNGEGGNDKGRSEDIDARTDGRRVHTCLEIHRKVVFSIRVRLTARRLMW